MATRILTSANTLTSEPPTSSSSRPSKPLKLSRNRSKVEAQDSRSSIYARVGKTFLYSEINVLLNPNCKHFCLNSWDPKSILKLRNIFNKKFVAENINSFDLIRDNWKLKAFKSCESSESKNKTGLIPALKVNFNKQLEPFKV